MSNAGSSQFDLSFQINPILLVGGIASGQTGGMSISDLLGGDSDDPIARFIVLNGGTLIDQSVATFPFANQTVAANATIANPNVVSLKMIIPAKDEFSYGQKLQVVTALQSSLAKHNSQGGTYTVATPSFYYDNGLLMAVRDISGGESKQAQIEWQFDFFFPLITLAAAQAAQSTLMNKISNATPVDGDPPAWSGASTTAGSPPGVGSSGSSPSAAPPVGSPPS